MNDFNELLLCSINDIIPILETIIEEEEERNITYKLVVSSSAYAEDIFLTINVQGSTENRVYELTRTDKYIGIKEV